MIMEPVEGSILFSAKDAVKTIVIELYQCNCIAVIFIILCTET